MGCAEWNEENWDVLIYTINQGDCILMLGPDTSFEEINGQIRPLAEILANELANEESIKQEIKEWGIDSSNLAQVSLCYASKKGRNGLLTKIKSFYEKKQNLTTEFHRNLASLPFYFAVTSTPDYMFYEALKKVNKENKKPIIESYNFQGGKKDLVQMGTVDKPLVFYLYGIIKELQSLVVTENDLLNFIVKLVSKNPPLPGNILSELQDENKSLLFLGFGFRNWYLRILLHVLELNKKQSSSFALEQFTPQNADEFKNTIFFFSSENKFNIQICNKKLNSFAKELKERYEKLVGQRHPTQAITKPTLSADAPVVFISYASEDKDYAISLYNELEKKGIKPWLDKENLRCGDRWEEVITKAINEEINYFLLLQSKALHSRSESVVFTELDIAKKRQTRFAEGINFIIPVKIDDTPFMESLTKYHTIDLAKEGIDRVIKDINRDQQLRRR